MSNKFSEIYLKKNIESFGSYENKKLVEEFGNDYTKKGPYHGIWSNGGREWGGGCPREYPAGTYDNFEKTKDNESRTICNTSCQRNYIYRELDKHTGGYTCSWYYNSVYKSPPYNLPRGVLHQVNFLDPDSNKDKNIHWKNEIEQCKIGEGDCGRKHCIGEWKKCGSNCKQKYKVIQAKVGSGDDCPHANNTERDCQPGDGDCPLPPGPPGPRGQKEIREIRVVKVIREK